MAKMKSPLKPATLAAGFLADFFPASLATEAGGFRKKSKISARAALAAAVLLSISGFFAGLYFAPPALKEAVFAQKNITAFLPENGYVAANVSIDGSRVSIRAGCRALSFDVTEDQALSIRFGLEKTVFSRPLSHDLIKDVLDHYGIVMESVSVDAFEDEVYKAKIILRQGSNVLNLDTRPSDAIALAVRYGSEIKIKSDMLADRGAEIC